MPLSLQHSFSSPEFFVKMKIVVCSVVIIVLLLLQHSSKYTLHKECYLASFIKEVQSQSLKILRCMWQWLKSKKEYGLKRTSYRFYIKWEWLNSNCNDFSKCFSKNLFQSLYLIKRFAVMQCNQVFSLNFF